MAREFNTLVPTIKGWVGISFSRKGVRRLNLPVADRKQALSLIKTDQETDVRDGFTDVDGVKQQVAEYFMGSRDGFNCRVDLSGSTSFQRRVWKAVAQIPYGQVRSYKWVAEKAGSPLACRAVGNALAVNPLPLIIPCHRVVCSDGKPGGFRGKAGDVQLKRMLLELEGSIDNRNVRRGGL